MKILSINTLLPLLRHLILLIFVAVFACQSGESQSNIEWFNPSSGNITVEDNNIPVDCDIKIAGFDKELGVEVVDFEPKPLFMHTQPQVKKWMKDKYLLECLVNVYRADETSFLLLHFKINSENAKHAYGDLEQGSQLKITFSDGEHIYVENIKRDRGTAQRSKGTTTYEGIYPLDGFDMKELGKKNVSLIGIVWEEGYQEYEVQNFNLIRNQINCLKKL